MPVAVLSVLHLQPSAFSLRFPFPPPPHSRHASDWGTRIAMPFNGVENLLFYSKL
jgi:hypothetical protein